MCDRSIAIEETESLLGRDYSQISKALDLRAHTGHRLAQLKGDPKSTKDNINEVLKDSRLSVRRAWMNLYVSAFRDKDFSEEKNLVSECILDLAYFRTHRINVDRSSDHWKYFRKTESALRSVLLVDPYDSNLHFEIGRILYCLSRQTVAGSNIEKFKNIWLKPGFPLQASLGLKPDDSKCWSYLALLDAERAEMYNPSEKESTDVLKSIVAKVERIPLYGPNADSSALEIAAQTYWYLKDAIGGKGKVIANILGENGPEYAEFKTRILRRAAFLAELNGALEEDANSCHFIGEKLKRRCRCLDNSSNFPQDRPWRIAQMRIHQLRHRRSKSEKDTPCNQDRDSVSCKLQMDVIPDLVGQTKEFLGNLQERKKTEKVRRIQRKRKDYLRHLSQN